MTDITWKITNLQCSPRINSYDNVVVVAQWSCIATGEKDDGTVTVSTEGMCSIPFIEPEDASTFIALESLTEQQVLDWCWQYGASKEAIEAQSEGKLAAIINPPITSVPLPWSV